MFAKKPVLTSAYHRIMEIVVDPQCTLVCSDIRLTSYNAKPQLHITKIILHSSKSKNLYLLERTSYEINNAFQPFWTALVD